MSRQFLRADGTLERPQSLFQQAWLPPLPRMTSALQFRLDEIVAQEQDENPPSEEPVGADSIEATLHTRQVAAAETTRLRHSAFMVIAIGVISGLLTWITQWIDAGQAGSTLPMLAISRSPLAQRAFWDWFGLPGSAIADLVQQMAGVAPRLPSWLAAGFSAVGGWVNTPLNLLALWIAYGAAVLAMTHWFGASTPLRRFFIVTSYGFLPLVLLIFQPIPYFGTVIALIAIVWSIVLYFYAVRRVTCLGTAQAVISMALPVALYAVAWGYLLAGVMAIVWVV